jgi:ATP-dependent Lon protease
MGRRPPKEHARKRKASEDMSGDPPPQPPKKGRYNLRDRKPTTIWVDDDTLDDDDDEDGEEEQIIIEIPLGSDDDDYIRQLFSKHFSMGSSGPAAKQGRQRKDPLPLALSQAEKQYYEKLPPQERRNVFETMKKVSNVMDDGHHVPLKFRILQLPISEYMKSMVLKKVDALAEMTMDSGGAYKLKTWVDGFLKIPFGRTVSLPVQMKDGVEKCTDFMVKARSDMNKHIYGMNGAKTQIMQVLSQWVATPGSIGNVIALQGPPGTGKTSIAKHAIANVLNRPFVFFALGGASDIANFVGHSYTYEGSTWGRIADAIMQAGTMNPVIYFDEVDKVSTTAHGEEIISMLIHLTDRTQNAEFHDRYFSGVNFDLSQCLFVFSFNDIEKVHPILRDRMNVIECGGYNEKDKTEILRHYVWPSMLERLSFKPDDIQLTPEATTYIIDEFSRTEAGVRSMIRAVETIVTRVNMLRVSRHESMKEYPFFMDVQLPLTITPKIVNVLMKDLTKTKQDEVWRAMYT